MSQTLQQLAQRIKIALREDLLSSEIKLQQLTIYVQKSALIKVLTFLRDASDLHFRQLTDLTAVDYPEKSSRFEVVYHLLSLHYNYRIRVKVAVAEGEAVPTLTGIFKAANWLEREVWDMYGIPFLGHPDLRRILTDYGFEGFPQRKDFPLTGYVEVRYDHKQKRVIYEPVDLQQDFRNFDFLSPWEGMIPKTPTLPGDEKVDLDMETQPEKRNASA